MKKITNLIVLLSLFNLSVMVSQDQYLDSLIRCVNTAPEDTHKLSLLTIIIEGISEDAVWSKYNDKLGPLAKKLMLSNNSGISTKAKKHYSDYLNNKGYLSNNLGDVTEALDYFHQSLKIQEDVGDKSGQSYSLNNIGYIYGSQKQLSRALEYYKKSLAIQTEIGDKHGEAQSLSNIGNIYDKSGYFKKALFYYFKGLNIRKSINDLHGMGYSLQNIGTVYFNQKNYFSALYYYTKSLEIRRKINDPQGISYSLCNMGKISLAENNTADAEKYSLEALDMSKKMGYPENISVAATLLEDIYLKEEKYDKAHNMLKLAVQMRDSISNDETHKSAVKKQLQYEFEKREVVSKVEQEKRELTYQASSKQQRIIIGSVIIGLVLCLLFGGITHNRFKITQRQNVIIHAQKKEVESKNHIIEEKQKEIVDSINYAKRIQLALLANHDLVNQYMPNNFILFKPKDIVSGDFYWATEHNNKFYLAVCDCTGHGVPGAFMSILSVGVLSEAIKEKNIEQPHEIFNYVRSRLINTIGKEGQQDGMDGILLCLDKSTNRYTYAAANNEPVLIINNQVIKLPKDKMPIGKGEKIESFTLYTISANKGDTLYLYTDGYADQFGGNKGKKFKNKHLNELLLSNVELPMREQKEKLDIELSSWKGNLEQVDDICIIGVKI